MPKPDHIQCVVVTPEKAVLDEEVQFVALPLFDGELGVYPGRTPLIGRLGYGELRTKLDDKVKRMFIDGGFVQIRNNVVTILTERALMGTSLNIENANAALTKAQEKAASPDLIDAQLGKQERARAQLRVAKRLRDV